ncbi:MAG TPA: epoxyqueuosine reductase QueH [Patescibacteria group bacterium]
MKLLLHGCCADCSLKFLESIKENKDIDEVDIYYYNPNIHPRSEYVSRLEAMQKICKETGTKLIIPDWSPKEYFKIQNPGATTEKERCPKCWDLRLGKTTMFAKEKGYEYFSSTLVTSQYQNQVAIRKIAQKWEKETGVKFFEPEKVCCELETKGFYKQFFCGCVYSMKERFEEKYQV